MSFRYEEKVILHYSDYLKILKMIKENNKKFHLYPSRKISSLYFDNDNNDMFLQGEEGTLPRKKIRLRHYPRQNKDKFFLEIKINSYEGKFKNSKAISLYEYKQYLKRGIFEKSYNICRPKFWVTYDREYYFFMNARITIDRNIKFTSHFNSNFYSVPDKLILEIKSKDKKFNILDGKFPFMRSRYSKYAEGHKILYK